ncbi:MAG: arylsulfatase [Phycisphaeraceae bacterium]
MLCSVIWTPVADASPNGRPNVLIVLADDQGWGDLSFHGNKDLATPNIDSLARDGAVFERFYVCAVCAPTRAEFLTGRYHPRTGVHGVSRGAERMNLDERTVAESFKAAGYATGCFGKWHNGMQYPYHPRARGFDTFVGFCSGHWGDYFDAELERDGAYFKSEGYITDVLTNEAIGFIETSAKANKPFFCFVPLCTPHSPMQVPDTYWDRFKDKPLVMDHPDRREESLIHTRAALAMVENIDDNVGRLLKKLDELELADHTIVIYFSDNGPNGRRWNGGMRGIKGSVDEGGLRVPMLMRWPAKIEAGTVFEPIAGAIDLSPTLHELAGVDRVGDKPWDGLSLAPKLTGQSEQERELLGRLLFSHQNGRISAVDEFFRLTHDGKFYNMLTDTGQSLDLSEVRDRAAAQMTKRVAAWRQDVGLNDKQPPRPFTVGHKDWPVTELPARDANTKGGIKRSSPHPNCSYFYNWTKTDDAIRWDVEVLEAGRYEARVYYACPAHDVGSTIALTLGDASVSTKITQAHDPPIEGEQENRVYRRESFVKDFKPMSLGTIDLPAGVGTLTLRATEIPGGQAMEFRRLMLVRVND